MHRILNYLFAVLDWNSATLLFRDLSALLVSYLPTVWFGNVPVHKSPNSERENRVNSGEEHVVIKNVNIESAGKQGE
jgi:hypothetical protein